MLGEFYPSKTADKIYDIIDDYEVNVDLYLSQAIDAIVDYFAEISFSEFQLICSDWPNCEGGTCSIAFMENGHSHLLTFDYIK